MAAGRSIARVAVGAACAIFDGDGRALLVRHTYGRLNWELPGGMSEPREAPDETARRELLEETGLRVQGGRLTGVYFEPEDDFGPMLHFVFAFRWHCGLSPAVCSAEVSEARYWPLDGLPRPISDFTERRLREAAGGSPACVARVGRRNWRE